MDNNKKKILKLKNGIQFLIIPMNTNLTDVSVNILLGQNHEKPNEMELTHYMEHLMGRFTSKKYNNYKQISDELNKRGAKTNASVSDYETKFYIQGYYKDIEYFIDLLANTIKDFTIDTSITNQEKQAVIQELKGYMSDKNYVFNMKIWKFMHNKYAYQYNYDMHIENIKKYNPINMINFIKNHILLQNIVVSITCPNDKIDDTTALIKKYFKFPNKNKKAKIEYPIYQYKNSCMHIGFIKNNNINNDTATLRLVVDDTIQYLSDEHLSLMYLQEILFSFETGIFYKILRDKLGLIYNIKMSLYVSLVNPILSSYYIESSCNSKMLPIFIKELLNIIKNLELTDTEINNGKKAFMIKNEHQKFNNLTSYNKYYNLYLLHKIPITERSMITKKLLKINNETIRNILEKLKKDIFKEGLVFYYAHNNMNSDIKKVLNIREKIKYVSL